MDPDPPPSRPLRRPCARIERERRFLLEHLPPAVDPGEFVRLRDHFLEGTHLRVRRVERPDGSEVVTKLGQKIPDPDAPDDPTRRSMTTIYLSSAETDRFTPQVGGPRSVKRRYTLVEGGATFAIDVWEAPAAVAGTVLAEVECDSDAELRAVPVPAWALREVTEDPAFGAVALASGAGG
ncbi:MAG: hypothetical protein AAFZ65_13585 [Planctomycetota bacterium]